MEDDLSIDDLLAAVATPQRSHKEPTSQPDGYIFVEYTQTFGKVTCTHCSIEYSGTMTQVKGMTNPYNNVSIPWCPNCIKDQEVDWWKHCFRMESVTSKPIKLQPDKEV